MSKPDPQFSSPFLSRPVDPAPKPATTKLNVPSSIQRSAQDFLLTLQKRGLVALIILITLPSSNFLLSRFSLDAARSDSRLINISGRQRMLSQRIAKNALQIQTARSQVERETYYNHLKKSLADFTRTHTALRSEDPDYVSSDAARAARRLFPTVEKPYTEMVSGCIALDNEMKRLENIKTGDVRNDPALEKVVRSIAEPSRPFLLGMESIVSTYQQSAENHRNNLAIIQAVMTMMIVAILGIFAFAVFRPVFEAVRNAVDELTQRQKELDQVNKRLLDVNSVLQDQTEAL